MIIKCEYFIDSSVEAHPVGLAVLVDKFAAEAPRPRLRAGGPAHMTLPCGLLDNLLRCLLFLGLPLPLDQKGNMSLGFLV